MAEERITEVETPSGNTHTTVVTDGGRSGGGGGTWMLVIVVLLIAAVGVWFVSGMNQSEVAKDNAVAEAANDVGAAAGQVGDAAQKAADNVGNGGSSN